MIKEVDYNPLKGRVDEMDFQALVKDEVVHSVAEIVLVNHDKLESGVLQQQLEEVSYKALPLSLRHILCHWILYLKCTSESGTIHTFRATVDNDKL